MTIISNHSLKPLRLTRHAQARCQQRGIRQSQMYFLLENHDVASPAGKGCSLIRFSQSAARHYATENAAFDTRRLCRLGAIVCDATGDIVTVFHLTRRRLRRARA